MKTPRLILFCASLIVGALAGNAQQISLSKCLGGNANDYAHDIKATSDGGYVLVGYTESSQNGDVTGMNHGGKDYWIVKLNAAGETQWQKNYGGSSNDEAWSIEQTSQNEYVVVGCSYSSDGDIQDHIGTNENCDVWIIRLNANGQLVWSKSIGGEGNETGIDVAINTVNHLIIAGRVSQEGQDVEEVLGSDDYWLVEMDLNGNMVWENVFGGSGTDVLQDMLWTPNNEIFLIGYSTSFSSSALDGEAYMVKVDEDGDQVWDLDLGTTVDGGTGYAGRMCMNDEGGVVVCYNSSTDQDGANCDANGSFLVREISPDGEIVENWCYGGGGTDQAMASGIDAAGHKWILGTTTSNDGDITPPEDYVDYGSNMWLGKADNDGTLLWNQSLGGSNTEIACSMLLTSDQKLILLANTTSSNGAVIGQHGANNDTHDIWLMIVNTLAENVGEVHAASEISIFPNPVNNILNLELSNVPGENAWLTISDCTGKTVEAVRINSVRYTFDTSHLGAGFYTARLTDDTPENSTVRFMKQ